MGMRWEGHVASTGRKVRMYIVLLRYPEITRLYFEVLGVDRDNIKMHHKEMRWFALHSTVTSYMDKYQAVVNTVMNLRVP
jgi:hypothetical protein